MATDKPFDARVVNPFERPTSNDFNLAQSVARGAALALAANVFNPEPQTTIGYGIKFVGRSFEVTQTSTPSMTVQITRGTAFQSALGKRFTSLGDVVGVDDITMSHVIPALMRIALDVTVPPAPTLSNRCRRDVIAIQTLPRMTDDTAVNVFNPSNQTFAPSLVNKTATYDLYDAPFEQTPVGGAASSTAGVVYLPGVEAGYSGIGSFLLAPLPIVPDGFTPICIINVGPNVSEITQGDIVDMREPALAGRTYNYNLAFTGGADQDQPLAMAGSLLKDISYTVAPFSRWLPMFQKYSAGGERNEYRIFIPLNLTQPGTRLSVGIQPVISGNNIVYPGQLAEGTFVAYNATIGFAVKELGVAILSEGERSRLQNPSLTINPNADVPAIGQPIIVLTLLFGPQGFGVSQLDDTPAVFTNWYSKKFVRNFWVGEGTTEPFYITEQRIIASIAITA